MAAGFRDQARTHAAGRRRRRGPGHRLLHRVAAVSRACLGAIPTTLLAQCDSCIGSKSSINIGKYKNQLGTFYPPRWVYLAPQVLRTLPFDDIRSGMGEIIKLHLLAGEQKFAALQRLLK